MKHTLFAIALISFVSCTKKPVCPPTPPTPTEQTPKQKLKGCWFSSYGSACFTDSLMSVNRDLFYPYDANKDTIFYCLDDGSKYAQYQYYIVNDTLLMYPTLRHPDAPFRYWR